ncbi:hypothetical protein ncot_07580 [Nocardioides sp. JQ2195]|uniref:hypothetical protein n=1 Tax=Nocardioides sp. JQ2195 TaxID=2592334 RepID=UPI00143E553E|nr:hypothetical protein [Nocardioides sp. JQ2195]QIX26481.1 hypothetical protein ncot_07580 [Nocardioides sp. JQ2195]
MITDCDEARVGEQIAVAWKRLWRNPSPASSATAGVSTGPPKGIEAPNPTSSSRTMTTLGASDATLTYLLIQA